MPAIVLGRFAVDSGMQGRGLGADLLQDALRRAASAGRIIGARAVLVHAIDRRAAGFYAKYGFVESPLTSRTMFLRMETIVAAMRA